MPLTRETNSEELEIVAKQVWVLLLETHTAPTVAFGQLLQRIEKENTEAEIGASELARDTA